MNTQSEAGFTLLELLVTLTVASIILGIGVPNLMEFQRNNAMASAANDFVTSVLAARAEAIKRHVPVTLCATNNPLADPPTCIQDGSGATGGFFVWVDENGNVDGNGSPIIDDATDGNATVNTGETVLRRIEAPGGQIKVFMDSGYLSFGANGFSRTATGLGTPSITRLLYCDDRGHSTAAGGLSAARLVQIRRTGRAEVEREIDQVEAGIAALGVGDECP